MFQAFRLSVFKRQVKSWTVKNVKNYPSNWLNLLDSDKFAMFF